MPYKLDDTFDEQIHTCPTDYSNLLAKLGGRLSGKVIDVEDNGHWQFLKIVYKDDNKYIDDNADEFLIPVGNPNGDNDWYIFFC